LASLRQAVRPVANDLAAHVLLYYTGSGMERDLRPGLDLQGRDEGEGPGIVFWDEVFDALYLGPCYQLTVLADCCRSNLLPGYMPFNSSGLVLAARPGQNPNACEAYCYPFVIEGRRVPRGVISYYATKALIEATTMEEWVHKSQELCDQDVAHGVLPS